MMEDADKTGFSLRMVPWYGWVALVIIGHALYYRNHAVALAALAGYIVAKRLTGKIGNHRDVTFLG